MDITEDLVEVGGDNDVDGLDDSREVLEQIFLRELELEESTINLVDDDDWLDTLTKSLTEHGLGLHTNTLNRVDDDKGTVCDTQSSSDL